MLKARLGDPQSLPDINKAKEHIASRMTSIVKNYIKDVEAGFKQQSSNLIARRTTITQRHRQERDALAEFQEQRWDIETEDRCKRLPRGFSGIWSRITGQYSRIRRQNEFETHQAYRRDQTERDTLIDRQLDERRHLQNDIVQTRKEHTREMTRLHQDVAHYMSLSEQEPSFMRDHFQKSATQETQRDSGRDGPSLDL